MPHTRHAPPPHTHTLPPSHTQEFKYALVWGTSSKHYPQRVGLQHRLEDEDVVQIVKKKVKTGEDGRGRFKSKMSDGPDRIADRVKKAALKS